MNHAVHKRFKERKSNFKDILEVDEIFAKKTSNIFFFFLLSNSYSESRPSQWNGQVVRLQQFIHDDFIY